jgi:hypothetical protein
VTKTRIILLTGEEKRRKEIKRGAKIEPVCQIPSLHSTAYKFASQVNNMFFKGLRKRNLNKPAWFNLSQLTFIKSYTNSTLEVP